MPSFNIRQPTVAGSFYPEQSNVLVRQLQQLIPKQIKLRQCIGCMLPHAGYMYSGKVAALTISCIKIPKTVILLGPKHHELGQAYFSIWAKGAWKTPLGEVLIDEQFTQQLLSESGLFLEDIRPHLPEHSLEVQLPFLQYLRADVQIVPIAVSSPQTSYLEKAAEKLSYVIKNTQKKEEYLILASSDMNHFQSQEITKKKDSYAIEKILSLDPLGLLDVVKRYDISMCGFEPVALMLMTARILGAHHAELVSYATSGDITGDYSEVVAYAGVIVY
ncbi:MAG: AmmeMemoRadiSam system protein B [Candidatus Omnitrophica bacterium]|nr:AmmeMemoRadiSam system protein B [Candidatus Omnitrophota bacterium]